MASSVSRGLPVPHPLSCADKKVEDAVHGLKRGRGKGGMALNKPLLLLFMLGMYWHNSGRMQFFHSVREPLEALLRAYCPGKLHHDAAIYPFWHMQSAPILWTLTGAKSVEKWYGTGSSKWPSAGSAMQSSLRGGFPEPLYRQLISDKARVLDLAFLILDRYFPKELHLPLLESVAIPSPRPRTLGLQEKALAIYRYSCAMCGYPGDGQEPTMSLQVAHFQSAAAGGLQTIDNSIAFCDSHKSLFDHGAFTIDGHGKIHVSEEFRMFGGSQHLMCYDGKDVFVPSRVADRPSPKVLKYHYSNVFLHV